MKTVHLETSPKPGHSASHSSLCGPFSGVNGGYGALACHFFSLTAITIKPVAMPVSREVTNSFLYIFLWSNMN